MPVNSMTSTLTSQIEAALSMDIAANNLVISQMIAAAVASMAGVGIIPGAPPIPIIPAGVAAGASQIQTALSMGPAAQIPVVAQIFAAGISVIGINAPPTGLPFLTNQVQIALSMDIAAEPSKIAQIIGSAVPVYYNMGGVI